MNLFQFMRIGRIARQGSRREHAALVRGIQRRRAIRVSFGELDFAFRNNSIYVVHAAGNESLQKIFGLMITELIEQWPQLLWLVNLFHSDAGSLRARL